MATSGSADVQVIPGPEATWTGQKTQGIVSSRTHTIIYPKAGGEFIQGNKIRLEIPSQDYWDMSLFTVSFRTRLFAGVGNKVGRDPGQAPAIFGHPSQPGLDPISAGTSHWLTTKNGIQSIFNRVRILQGSTVIADVQEYGKLNRLLRLVSVTPGHQKHIDYINEGVYDPEDWEQKKCARNFYSSKNAASNEGHYFNVRFNTGFLEVDKYFPTKYTGQITFEIYMEQNENCLRSSRQGPFSTGHLPSTPNNTEYSLTDFLSYPAPTYMVDDVQAHVHFVVPIQEYDEEMMSTIESQGLTIMYNTWSEHTRQINSVGRSVHSFQERAVSVRGGLAVMENEFDLSTMESEYQFASNNISEFQWKLGNTYIPAQPVLTNNGPARAIMELEDFLNISGDPTAAWLIKGENFLATPQTQATANATGLSGVGNTASKTWDNFMEMRLGNTCPNQFCMALNLEKSPGQLSGFNTSATNVDIELRLTLEAQNKLSGNLVGDTGRGDNGVATWEANQGSHTFQPSKFCVHDTTTLPAMAGDVRWFSGQQPNDRTYNGEGHGRFNYNASEDPASLDAANTNSKPLTRFPGSAHNGGYTSTSFMATKEPHKYSLLTFWANVDAQVNIIRVGQMEVLR